MKAVFPGAWATAVVALIGCPAIAAPAVDLGGIGPGYGVDAIGDRLRELASTAHLVELGGEVRAWGRRPDGTAWRVALGAGGRVIELDDGLAIAASTAKPGRSPRWCSAFRPASMARSRFPLRARP